MHVSRLFICVLVVVIISAAYAIAAVPPIISYQGKLMQPNGTPVPDGTYSIRFAIYDAPTEGNMLWSEPNPSVQVKGGLFAVLLGSLNNLGANILDSESRYLGIKLGSDAELSPRQRIASVATALRAGEADVAKTVVDGAITADKLASCAVSEASIAAGAVSREKIANDTIDASKIMDATITTAKLSLSALCLGYAERTSIFTTDSVGTWTDVPGLSVIVTIPDGGRRIKITVYSGWTHSSGPTGTGVHVSIREGETLLQDSEHNMPSPQSYIPYNVLYSTVPTAGQHTYKVSILQSQPGTLLFGALPTEPAFILVEIL